MTYPKKSGPSSPSNNFISFHFILSYFNRVNTFSVYRELLFYNVTCLKPNLLNFMNYSITALKSNI